MADLTGLTGFVFILAIFTWSRWYAGLLTVSPLASPMRFRFPMLFAPFACMSLVLVTLLTLASPDVRSDGWSIATYAIFGAAWLGGATLVFPLLGLSVRDDVVERHNASAAWVLGGSLVGVTCCFAGSNIGSGPGPEVVFFCAVLSTLSFFLCWLGLELIANLSEAITVDRDIGTGIRLAGFTAALGILLGNAVAGPWDSTVNSLRDFGFFGWPALLLLAIAIVVEKIKTNSLGAPVWRLRSSIGLAFSYLAGATLYVGMRGNWS